MANRRYITLETAPELLGKTVDCFVRKAHYYPLKVVQMKNGRHFIIDRNGVAMPISESEHIPYDFIVKEATNDA